MRALWLILLFGCGTPADTDPDTDAVPDPDGDGFLPPSDCNDQDPTIYPGATEVVADGIDQSCDGTEVCFSDADADGYHAEATITSEDADCDDPGEALAVLSGGDCADGDPARNPAAKEVCDPEDRDENCDGLIDEEDPEAEDC